MNNHAMIAVQGAMDVEISTLLEAMGNYKEETYGNFIFYVGKINEIKVVVSKTEMGMVNAAAATTLLIEKYHPEVIINQGTAGGHDPDIHVFDTVIGTEVINLGCYRSEHLNEGQGIAPTTWIPMETGIREENGQLQFYSSLNSDPELVKAVLKIANKYKYGKVVEGKIGSADFWNREVDRIRWFHQNAGTCAEDMEAFAVAQVAKIFNIPYLSIRTISNSEVTDDNIEDLETAGHYCAEFTVEFIKTLRKG